MRVAVAIFLTIMVLCIAQGIKENIRMQERE